MAALAMVRAALRKQDVAQARPIYDGLLDNAGYAYFVAHTKTSDFAKTRENCGREGKSFSKERGEHPHAFPSLPKGFCAYWIPVHSFFSFKTKEP